MIWMREFEEVTKNASELVPLWFHLHAVTPRMEPKRPPSSQGWNGAGTGKSLRWPALRFLYTQEVGGSNPSPPIGENLVMKPILATERPTPHQLMKTPQLIEDHTTLRPRLLGT